jgi:sugar-phosphatase
MIRAALFDLDGLLIDSEPLWRRAERSVFAGVGLELSDEDCAQTLGLRVDEVVRYWFDRHPWDESPEGASRGRVEEEIRQAVEVAIRERGEALPGAREALELCRRRGWPLAIASSSPLHLIEAAVAKLRIRPYFRALISAENEAFGKPHPAVYLRAAEALGVESAACLVFEDSLAGLIAAKAARMGAVVVPAANQQQDLRWSLADATLRSLADLDASFLDRLEENWRRQRSSSPPPVPA